MTLLRIVEHFAPNLVNAKPIENLKPKAVEIEAPKDKTNEFFLLKITDSFNSKEL